jgi:hypothetical protein
MRVTRSCRRRPWRWPVLCRRGHHEPNAGAEQAIRKSLQNLELEVPVERCQQPAQRPV